MMYSTVVEDKDTLGGWICIHDRQDTLKPFHKLIAIVPTDLDMTVNNAIHCKCRKHRVAYDLAMSSK
jgi:hypothetical protein